MRNNLDLMEYLKVSWLELIVLNLLNENYSLEEKQEMLDYCKKNNMISKENYENLRENITNKQYIDKYFNFSNEEDDDL